MLALRATPRSADEWITVSDVADRGLTVFNIAGNKYRLVVNMRYDLQIVFILRVFTHREYDDWNEGRR